MKNKYLILLMLLLVSGFSFAQTYTMPTGNGVTATAYSTCGVTFVDNGGAGGNYTNSQNSTITFTPATPGDLIRVSFTSFDVETNATCAYDRLEVWNGTTATGPATGQYCGVLPAFSVISSAPGGQLTFRFTSDGVTVRPGWVATVSCVTPCSVPTANLTTTADVNICPATSVTPGSTTVAFDASNSVAGSQGPISRYEWKWSDGTPNTSTTTPTTTHTFPTTGGVYIVELQVRNSNFDIDPLGCLSTNAMQRVIKVLPPPNFTGSTASPVAAACNTSVNLTGIAATQNYTSALPAAESIVTTLPDGNGVSYTTGINYTGFFPTGATVTPGCYPTVTLNLEHSYSSDLNIDLIAPTGQTVRLFAKNGTTGLTTYKFGTCVNGADDGADGCGAVYTVVNPGTAGAINWSAFGTGAAQSGTTTTATCPMGTPLPTTPPTYGTPYTGTCESGTYFKSRTYNSDTAFTALNGAALNGTWSIRITDTLAADDGNLFYWNLTFPPACLSSRATANPDLTAGVWSTTGSGPAVPANSSTSVATAANAPDACPVAGTCPGTQLTNTVSVGPFTAGGSYVYNYTVTDEFGCQYVRPVTINVPAGPTFTVPANITQCVGSTVAIANFTSTPAGAVFTWTNSNTAIGLAASGSGSVPAFTATNTGTTPITATITVTATPGAGCPTVHTYTITINPAPTATFTDPPDQCLTGNSFTFTNTGTTGAGYTHSWNFGGAMSNTSTATSPSGVSYAAAGTYTITHTVTDTASTCNAIFTQTIVVFPSPTAIATTLVDAHCGLSDGSITITGVTSGTAPYTYSVCGSPFTATTSYTGLPAQTCSVIVKDANGCTFTKSVTILDMPGPTAQVVTTVNSSCGASNGAINIGATTGGVAPYTYSVCGSAFTSATSYPGLPAGTCTVIVKDANGCTFTTSGSVSNNTAPTAIASTIVNANCGAANGSITLGAVTGGTAPYTYDFGNPANGVFDNGLSNPNLAAGTYTVSVKDASGCVYTTTLTVLNNPGPTAIATTVVDATCGASNGCITITGVTGGTAPYTYSFNVPTGVGPYTATTNYCSLAAGTYNIEVKDANGCLFLKTVTIINKPGPTAIATTVVDATCGASNGCITITGVTGGTAPYTYSFNVATGVGPYTATTNYCSLAAGTYNIEVKDANGCLFLKTVTIINKPGPTAIATTIVNASCGTANGCITITGVTGGTAPYTYSFNVAAGAGPYNATTNFCSLLAGSYNIEVKDANGCLFFTTVTVMNNTGPTAIATTIVNSSCGAANGCITITGTTGGTAPYTYSFNAAAGAGPYNSITNFCSLLAGSYNIEVKDANGCLFLTSVTIIDNPGPTGITTTVVNSSCGAADGCITITGVTGGTAPYTYSFNNPGVFTATTNYCGLLAGSYPVEIKDANGCIYMVSVNVIDNLGPTAIATTLVNPSCGQSDGSVTITGVTGGVAPYTYDFGNPANAVYDNSVNNPGLPAATYTVSVKDANGCVFTTTVTLIDAAGPTAVATTLVNSNCGAADGCVTIGAVTGGLAPYTYSFNSTTAYGPATNYCGLLAGTYPIYVKDANGCIFMTTITIIDNPGPTAIATTLTNSSCGSANGCVDITGVTGGAAPYVYSFDGSAFTTATNYCSVLAGSHTVEVKDINGCTFLITVTVINNPGPTAIASTVVDAACGASNGSITITGVTGGTAPYTYSFNNPPGVGPFNPTPTSFTGLPAGSYPVEVKDANGCIFATVISINNAGGPTSVVVTHTDATCGSSNGTVNIGSVTGGTSPYLYSFNNPPGVGPFVASPTNFTGLPAGNYAIEVKDASGCIFATSVTILDNPGPTAIATTIVDATCGAANGSVTITGVTGGTAPYTYSFDNLPGVGPYATTPTSFTGLTPGTYNVEVKDANGCLFLKTVTIIDKPGPTAVTTVIIDTTCGASNGSVTFGAVTGGTGPYTFSFDGSPYVTNTVYSGLPSGPHMGGVTDANGCIYTFPITINDLPGPTAVATTIVDESCGSANGSITITGVTGGTSPYTYYLNVGPYSTATSFTGLSAGSYTISVKDANGCIFNQPVTIANPGGPTSIASTLVNESCSLSNGSVTLGTVTGGVGPYTYQFGVLPAGPGTSYTNLPAGVYPLIVTDTNGCTYSTSFTLINTPSITDIAVTTTNETCTSANGTITLGTVTGGTAPFTYSVCGSPASATTSYTGLSAGTCTITVTDSAGCTYSEMVTITDSPKPTDITTTQVNETCTSANGSITLTGVIGGTAPYTYTHNGTLSGSTTVYSGLTAGPHIFVVTDANGCTYTETVTLTDAPGPTAIASTTTNATCGVSNGCVTFGAVTGGTAPYQIDFENNGYSATTNYCGLGAGAHIFSVKDANGCIFSSVININNVGGATDIVTTVGNASCGQSNGTLTLGAVTGGTPPYNFVIDTNPPSTATSYTGLSIGTHSVTVTGANGCVYSENFVILDQPGPTAMAFTIVDSTCGNPNGSVTFGTITGGTPPYTYTVTAGTPTSYGVPTTYSALAAGPYLLGVKDANGCILTQSITITTTTAPTANISYANAPFCNSICATQPVTLTGTGVFTGGTYSATPAGLTINAANGEITPCAPTVAGTYTVTYTIPPTAGCPAITATTMVAIDPILRPVITCGTPTTTSVQFNWNAITGATGYTVSYTVNGGVASPVTPIGNVTTYTVTTNPADSVTITVTPTGGFGTCFGSTTFTCVANSCVPSSASIAYAGPFCSNSGTPKPVTLNGTGNYTGGTYTVAPLTGLFVNATTGEVTPTAAGTYTVTYTLAAAGGCPAVTNFTTVIVTPLPSATINYAGSPYCSSLTAPQSVTINGTGAYTGGTYTASPGGLTISATTGAITPSAPTVPGIYTVTYTIPASAGCPTVPVTTSVTITQQPSATISYTGSIFCVSDNSPKTVNIMGTGAYTGGVYSGPGLIIDSTTGTITGGTAGPHTVTYTIPASAGCGIETATTTVTVNALPVATATPSTPSMCSGATTNIALSSSIPGTTFTWTVVETAPSGASNGSGNSINQTLTITGSTAATVTYTITPTANGCIGNSITATVTVNPSPNVIATPSVQTICSGQTTGIVLTSSTPGTTYTWIATPVNVSGSSNGSGNFISQTLTALSPTVIGTVVYTITPTGSTCSGAPINVTVYVTPPPVATATTPSGTTICSGDTTDIVLTSTIPGTVFNWNVIASSVLGSSNGSGNVINQTLTNVGTNPGRATYAITPVTSGCPGQTIFVDIIVNPIPVVTTNTASNSICSGTTTAISLSSNIAATTYSWTQISSGLVYGAHNGSGNLIADTLTVVGSASGSVEYTITPFANGCAGSPAVVTIIVRPIPEVFGNSSVTICSGESPNITLFPSIPGTTFTWTSVSVGVSGATANGSSDMIDDTLTTTGTSVGTVIYTVTPTANTCTGNSVDFTVTVNPLPTPVLENGIICVDAAGNTFQTYTFDTGFNNADYDFVWFYDNGTTTTTINNASNSSYEASAVGTYSVQVTNTITGCVSPLVSATVTASSPAANVTATASLAFTDNATITVLPAGYLYSLDEGAVQEENVFQNLTPGLHSVTITDVNGCTNETKTVFIIGYPHYFTPNGDGINDNWNIIGLDAGNNAKIYIFDRYGKLIKQISPTGEGWDGTYNGERLPSTDYWFTVEYIELGAGKLFNSHFSLKR